MSSGVPSKAIVPPREAVGTCRGPTANHGAAPGSEGFVYATRWLEPIEYDLDRKGHWCKHGAINPCGNQSIKETALPQTSDSQSSSTSARSKRNIAFAAICFLALMTSGVMKRTFAQEEKANKLSGSVSGRVTIQGKPAPGLELVLSPEKDYYESEKPRATITTDQDGRYQFEDVPANHYWLKVKSLEYLNLVELRPRRRVSVADGATVTDADIDLVLGGAVSGRIADIDGNPVARESVHLFAVTDYGRSTNPSLLHPHGFKSNESGEYRITGVPPGRYLVGVGVDIARLTGAVRDKHDLFSAQGRVGRHHYFEQVFYPGTADLQQAHHIDISLAAEVQGIDINLGRAQPSFTARGRVIDAQSGKLLPGKRRLRVTHRLRNGGYMGTLADDQVNEDGTFEITGLLSERFSASVDFTGDTNLYSDMAEFEINGADVAGLEIKAHLGFTVTGVVEIEGERSADSLLKRTQIKLRAASPVDRESSTVIHREVTVNDDGTFKIVGLPRGSLEISIGYCESCSFFKLMGVEYPMPGVKGQSHSAREGWRPDRRVVNVASDIQDVRVMARYDAASILCHVNVIGALPQDARLMILIHRRIDNGGWGGWRRVDANGDMLEAGLEPGTYELTLGDGMRRFSKAQQVTVRANRQTEASFAIDARDIQKPD